MQKQNRHTLRPLFIVALFCLACVVYLGRLFYIQIAGKVDLYNAGNTTRTVTIRAVRGEIYDRNGKPLVKNQYTYDLTLTHDEFSPLENKEANKTILFLLSECEKDNKHEEKYFPFDGQYPNYSFSQASTDPDSAVNYRLRRVLKDLGLSSESTAEEIRDYYAKTYELLATDSNGNRVFGDAEVDRLLRLRYDMNAMQFSANNNYVFASDVSIELMTRIKEPAPDGVTFAVNAQRVYCYPGYASHILGTVGPIYSEEWEYYNEQGYQMNAMVGKSGCEAAFEQYLRGSDGVLLIEEDAAGNVVNVTVKSHPIAGQDIYLTIDIDLQIAAEDGLKENVEYVVDRSQGDETRGFNCNAGAAVAIDPNTFDVLAIASYPSFDLTTYNADYAALYSDPAKPLFNRALDGAYAPGSTYKPGVAIAGLMSGKLDSLSSTINCSGIYPRYHRPKCSTYGSSHWGNITVKTAVTTSCNCFFYELGYRMGIDTLNDYMVRFGIGQATGLELGGTNGVLAGPTYRQEIHGAVWEEGDVLSAAIGQSDNQASPLQLATYIATLSNGGTRYAAHLLKDVYTFGNDTPVHSYDSTKNILSTFSIPKDYQTEILSGMRDMITTHYTANRFMSSIPVEVGGKTGTAQTPVPDIYNALFVCAAPYENPEIVISVVLENGYSGEYSSLTAARILEQCYGVEK